MATTGPDDIGSRRKVLGLSQGALAERVGVSQGTISNRESGRSIPSEVQVSVLRSILDAATATPFGDVPTASAEYGEWLQTARIRAGLSVQELAANAGVSQPAIYNIETGRTPNPRSSTRQKLETALGTSPPGHLVKAIERESEIEGVGQFVDFDPHDESDFPKDPGVYVFYDVSDRPIYVGQSQDIRRRIRTDHVEKFWYRRPIVEKASYVRVDNARLRDQLERTLIKFLKSDAVLNKQQVER